MSGDVDPGTQVLSQIRDRAYERLIEAATDWLMLEAFDLRGKRPREETRKLVSSLSEWFWELLLNVPTGPTKRDAFIEYVTTYRASSDFRVSTLLRGFWSFKKGLQSMMARVDMPAEVALDIVERVDQVYVDSIFVMSDVYVEKLRTMIAEGQAQLSKREDDVEWLERELSESLLTKFAPLAGGPDNDSSSAQRADDKEAAYRSPQRRAGKLPVTVLFVDVAEFSTIVEQLSADQLDAFIDEYQSLLRRQVAIHGGVVEHFVGVTAKVLFGASDGWTSAEQVQRCLRCALDMRFAMLQIDDSDAPCLGDLFLRVGVDCGSVWLGDFDPDRDAGVTTFGSHVERARALLWKCQPGDICVTNAVAQLLPSSVTEYGRFQVHHASAPQPCYRLDWDNFLANS